ncbi:HAD hydrolase-like protein [Burkholderia orbicola]|uniref:HAD hydrolase-like protein n=1 Tax=Burkholderia orbicola TaxID=2978683 RepID=UPI0035C6A506
MEKWITFDCYGTLIDWRLGMTQALEIVSSGNAREIMAQYRRVEFEVELGPYQLYRHVKSQTVRRIVDELGIAMRPGDEDILTVTMPFWPVFDDTNAALHALKSLGYKLAILSNVDRDIIAGTLRHFDVVFDLIITAQDVLSYKPRDAHAKKFLEVTGVKPGNWLYAAYDLDYDLQAAGRSLGAGCVWVNRDKKESTDTSFLVADLPDISTLPEVATRYFSTPQID